MKKICITVFWSNTEGFFCVKHLVLMQMLINAIGRESINNIWWKLLFEFKTIDVYSRSILLRKNEIEDMMPSLENAFMKAYSFRKAKLIKSPKINLNIAVFNEESRCRFGLKILYDTVVILKVNWFYQKISSFFYKLLVARIFLEHSLACSWQSYNLIIFLIWNIKLVIGCNFHHL